MIWIKVCDSFCYCYVMNVILYKVKRSSDFHRLDDLSSCMKICIMHYIATVWEKKNKKRYLIDEVDDFLKTPWTQQERYFQPLARVFLLRMESYNNNNSRIQQEINHITHTLRWILKRKTWPFHGSYIWHENTSVIDNISNALSYVVWQSRSSEQTLTLTLPWLCFSWTEQKPHRYQR